MLSISSREAWRVEVADRFLCRPVGQPGFTQYLTVDHFLLINNTRSRFDKLLNK